MLTGIDHLVIVVPDLEAAVSSYGRLGFTVVPGGRHPIGTHNALIAFADGAYLELIAFHEPSPGHRWWTRLQQGGGLADFCVQTDDIAAAGRALATAGVALEEPRPLSRLRPDGYRLQWTLTIPAAPYAGLAPFLIVDDTPRDERVPRERSHANGVRGIAALTLALPADRLAEVRGWYAAVLGRPGQAIRRDDVPGDGVRFMIGPHALDLVAAAGAGSGSPWGASLIAGGARRALDPGLTQGARLTLV